jgi:hypothetical protein
MEMSPPMSELFSSPPNLNSSAGQSDQVTSRTWPVAASAAAWLISAITCLSGSIPTSSIGYGASIVATVVAMFAALDQRQRELNANYVRRGLNVAAAARALRVLALITGAVNILRLANEVAK